MIARLVPVWRQTKSGFAPAASSVEMQVWRQL
jgi:hypothetical protein